MIPFIAAHSYAPCIFIDGPLAGQVSDIACVAPDWPASEKAMRLEDEETIVIYRLIYVAEPKPHWQQDEAGNYMLTLKDPA